MNVAMRNLGNSACKALDRGRAMFHELCRARAATMHPWLFIGAATAPHAAAMLAEEARRATPDTCGRRPE